MNLTELFQGGRARAGRSRRAQLGARSYPLLLYLLLLFITPYTTFRTVYACVTCVCVLYVCMCVVRVCARESNARSIVAGYNTNTNTNWHQQLYTSDWITRTLHNKYIVISYNRNLGFIQKTVLWKYTTRLLNAMNKSVFWYKLYIHLWNNVLLNCENNPPVVGLRGGHRCGLIPPLTVLVFNVV